ncbi:MAG: NADP-dependent isocitrate dehydrogenase, partial [Pseudomonadota bacterium]|nr:NADP-dependent isocitrate dehydrogenase [Pseudomonadota bacterium]
MTHAKIFYTKTDEAPALATYSLLPIIKMFTASADIDVVISDISLASRILAHFPSYLTPEQQVRDTLAELGELTLKPEANIIKLPNISASIPQLKSAIKELQDKGFKLPDYPESPENEAQKLIKTTYDKVKGSAVNPVLREGNSDRRAPLAVKNYVRKHPHSMGAWSSNSKSHVASMSDHDFYGSERSVTLGQATKVTIELEDSAGKLTVLKNAFPIVAGEIIDASVMSKNAFCQFIEAEIDRAKKENVLFSVHLKATMMKVSDPIIFGHVVSVFFKDVFAKHAALFEQIGVKVTNGLGDVYNKMKSLPAEKQAEIEADIKFTYASRPNIAMADSDKGITNLHVPS